MTADGHDAVDADRDRDARVRADLEADRDGDHGDDPGRSGGVSAVIGSLAARLRDRLGRDWGDCRTCGRPTRSHRLGSGVQCHRCYVAGERLALADGGDDLDAETVRALLERERIDPDTATVAQAIGAVDELTLDDRPLVATVLDGDDATTGSYPSDSNETPPRGVTSEAPDGDQDAVDDPDSTREQPVDKRVLSDTRTAEHDGSEGATGLSSEDNPGGVTAETGDASATDDRRDRRDHRATDPADDESLGAGDTNRVRHTSDPGDVEDDTSTDERDTAGSGPTGQDKPGETDTRDHDDHDDERADHDLELTETRERDPVDTAGADDPDALDPDAGYLDVFRTAQRAHGSERWEYVTEDELRAALDRVGHADLLDRGILARGTDWRTRDFADDGDDDPDHRYYYVPAAPDPDPAEFRRFHDCLMAAAPDGYQPYYFRVEPVGKAPDTRYGSWKDEVNRLSFDEALAHMEDGGNVGIAGTPGGPLVNIDVDDGEATTPDDLPETLRAISRSRTGWHGWGFNPAGDIPNLPTDDLGEVRTDWQYLVAPGSFVACAPEEIPDDADRPGYYTVENEAPVPTITFDDLPEAFREWENDRDETHPPTDAETGADLVDRGDDQDDQDDQDDDTDHDTASDVFDVDAGDVVRSEGGDTDVSERWTSLFHGSDTSANMSVSDKGRLQCWRHNVAHGGLQALAALSKHSPSGDRACRQIGTGHTHSNAGGCRYAGDWRLIWWAWEYAKGNGYLDDDDPIPFRALVNLAVRDDALDVDREDLVERETDDGGTYLGFPDAGAYNAALDHVRDEYDRDPGRVYAETGQDTDSGDREPVAPLALRKLDALTGDARERHARRHGLDVPTTSDARNRLRDALFRAFRSGSETVLDAPTALGKSYTVATTPWLNHADVTGEAPVVHLHATTDARDEAITDSKQSAVTWAALKGRKERSPLARGDHDPPDDTDDPEDAPDVVVTIDGKPASEWFDEMCGADDQPGKGLPFSTALALARERNDQGLDDLPPQGREDPAVAQWNGLPRDDDGDPAVDVIHATHPFAYVPSLRRGTNVVLDEQPDYTVDLRQERVRRMVNAYLQAIDAPVTTWEALVSLARLDHAGDSDAGRERDALDDILGRDPPTEWYVDDPDAHALAPDLTRAIWRTLRWDDVDPNRRRSAKVLHEPPRLAGSGDGDTYAGVWLSVVVDDENTVRTIRATPDFSQARAVVGLDAHPCLPMWALNASPNMTRDAVLDPDERRLWRRFERGLTIVQVGDATRPRSGENAREWMNDQRVRATLSRLHDHYGDDLGTGISPLQVEAPLRRCFEDVLGSEAVDAESTMHYGEEKSRNDFADERVGYLYGCMDPGDDMILDALAELDLDATAATTETEAGVTVREKGRAFEGDDAETARALLASVRENHVAQAAGRYARNPDDPDSEGIVYVHTDATPTGYADLQVPGVEWLASDLQREIIDALTERPTATTRELAETVDCSKEHVRQTLARLEDRGLVRRDPAGGEHGADVYQAGDDVEGGVVDVGGDIANDRLEDTSRWSLVVSRPTGVEDGPPGGPPAPRGADRATSGTDPPPPGD